MIISIEFVYVEERAIRVWLAVNPGNSVFSVLGEGKVVKASCGD